MLGAMLRPSVAHAAFDADLFTTLRQELLTGALSFERARLAEAPGPLERSALTSLVSLDEASRTRLRIRGEAAIDSGKVAALVLNGGMATRFGGVVKGVVSVVPGYKAMSFLAVKLAGLRAVAALGGRVPVVVMHSFATAAASREHLAAID